LELSLKNAMYVHVKIGIKKKQAFDLLAIHACIIVLSCLVVGGKSKFYKAPETFTARLFIKGTFSLKTTIPKLRAIHYEYDHDDIHDDLTCVKAD